jgi:hypothetical protein
VTVIIYSLKGLASRDRKIPKIAAADAASADRQPHTLSAKTRHGPSSILDNQDDFGVHAKRNEFH